MKRYLVFAYNEMVQSGGGWKDFDRDFDSKDYAIVRADALTNAVSSAHVVDTVTGELVYEA